MLQENTSFKLILIRHGETLWAKQGRHTGRTDISLTVEGEAQAQRVGYALKEHSFSAIYSSPLKRALQTCHLAGFKSPTIDPDLSEWDYGAYEGLYRPEILEKDPKWDLFITGCPGGESPQDVALRARRFLARCLQRDAFIFSSAHILRMIAASWVGQPIDLARHLILKPASISILGFEHGKPVIIRWNDISHLSYK